MEVHKHPHHVMHSKKWHEYLLEFFMLFLAVFLGFIAENIRENNSNKRQANEYIQSMLSDLKEDVSMYKSNDSSNLVYCSMIDTLFSLENNSSRTGEMYYLARKLTMMGSSGPAINSKTYLQMTSTGAFRFIKKQGVADSIALYYQQIKSFENWAELQHARINGIIATNDKLFNANVLFAIYKAIESHGDSLQQVLKSNPSLMTTNTESINAVMIHYQYYYGFMKLMINRDDIASAQAQRLIRLLEKEYDL